MGRNTWTLLHSQAAYYPDDPSDEIKENMRNFLFLLSETYPCHICAADLKRLLKEMPPRLDSREEFVQYMCELHNAVNKQLYGKPQFDCSKCDMRWRRGSTDDWHDIVEEIDGEIEYDDDDDY